MQTPPSCCPCLCSPRAPGEPQLRWWLGDAASFGNPCSSSDGSERPRNARIEQDGVWEAQPPRCPHVPSAWHCWQLPCCMSHHVVLLPVAARSAWPPRSLGSQAACEHLSGVTKDLCCGATQGTSGKLQKVKAALKIHTCVCVCLSPSLHYPAHMLLFKRQKRLRLSTGNL